MDDGVPHWLTATLVAAGTAIGSLFTYLGLRKTKDVEQVVEVTRAESSTKVELAKIDLEESKILFAEYRAYLEGMKGQITELRTAGNSDRERIGTLETRLDECEGKHEACQQETAKVRQEAAARSALALAEAEKLKTRIAELETKVKL